MNIFIIKGRTNEKKQSGPLRHPKGLEMVIWHLLTLSCHNNIKGANAVRCSMGSTIPFNSIIASISYIINLYINLLVSRVKVWVKWEINAIHTNWWICVLIEYYCFYFYSYSEDIVSEYWVQNGHEEILQNISKTWRLKRLRLTLSLTTSKLWI
jgi:hypothetical protein